MDAPRTAVHVSASGLDDCSYTLDGIAVPDLVALRDQLDLLYDSEEKKADLPVLFSGEASVRWLHVFAAIEAASAVGCRQLQFGARTD